MGSFAGPHGVADAELQIFILSRMTGRRKSSVVSVNAILVEITAALPACELSHDQLIAVISEAAMLLGLVPVFDPSRQVEEYDSAGAIRGYGHRAHQPDASASYVFSPGPVRTLPISKRN